MRNVTRETYSQDPTFPGVAAAVTQLLAEGDVVAPVEVMIRSGRLQRADYLAWRQGKIQYLERAVNGSLEKISRILRILEEQPVSSQAQLVQMLEGAGIVATQATVSRDLEELGAVKVRIPGGAMAYAIPDFTRERAPSDDHLKRLMSEFVVEVAHSANMVVLRTPPGSAHVVASALDRASLGDVLGTVAGDDTVLVVCNESVGGIVVATELAGLAGL